MSEPITWASEPVFDTWGWAPYWSMADWLTWLQKLTEHYGRKPAADKFYTAWMGRTGFWESLGDERANWLGFSSGFRGVLNGYTMSNGSNLLKMLEDSVYFSGTTGGASDAVSEIGTGLGYAGGTISNLTKLLKYAVPAVVVLAIIAVFFLLYTNRNNLSNLNPVL